MPPPWRSQALASTAVKKTRNSVVDDATDQTHAAEAEGSAFEALGWAPKDLNVLVHCSNGSIAASPGPTACTNGCVPGMPAGSALCSP